MGRVPQTREVTPSDPVSYYRARYYDPQAGRLLSEDPIGFRGGINFYRYSFNNSVNLIDPFGLTPAPTIPWPLPWFPPGTLGGALGGVVDAVGKLAIPITVVYKLTLGAPATARDEDRIKRDPTPCDKGKDKCRQAKEDCIESCSDVFPTNRMSQGTPFYRCMQRCMAAAGCSY